MSYPANKGYVSALVVSTTAPDNKAALWAVGPDADNVADFRFYVGGSWQSIEVLFNIAHVGATAPSDQTKIWCDTSGTPAVYRIYDADSASWRRVDELYPITTGATPPSDARRLWKRQIGNSFSIYIYNTVSEAWEDLLLVPSIDASSGINVSDEIYNGKILVNDKPTACIITLEQGIPVDVGFMAERQAAGAVEIKAVAGVELNGVDAGAVTIDKVLGDAHVRVYAPNKIKVKGDII